MLDLKSGAILLISGPSGCGKSTLLKELYKEINEYYFSISTTTRKPRIGEQNGVDYYFVTKEEFEEDISRGEFLEYAKVHENYYGTSLKPILKALEEKKLVIFDIDVQGQEIVKNSSLSSYLTTVFITTPSKKILKQRLEDRKTDEQEVINKRLSNAKKEILSIDKYDYIIVNNDIKTASSSLVNIAKCAMIKGTLYNKEEIIKNWIE
ncbi:MAG: guanylate kinase [Arcobacter butzleri]|jgi:guanylate kinase|nr:guanylate kinase [Arcobacteraceae bacterium]MDY0364752.1 guanylate kinase [Arcobacteraceae bacterium]NLO18186.1 guanylate kinase [Aliarcobacter butzleri]